MKDLKPKKQRLRLSDDVSLELQSLHEIMGEANLSLALTVAAKLSGPIVWIGRAGHVQSIMPSAVGAFLDPARMVLTECTSRKELLWAAEQAMRCSGAVLTVIHLAQGPNLKESRRMQLACEQGGGMGLILIERNAQSSAAQTRWTCQPIPANDTPLTPHWSWERTKSRNGGRPGRWHVTWGGYGQTCDVHMVAATAA